MYGILFLGIGLWTAKLIKVPELQKSSNVVQVFFRLSLCLMPFMIASLTYKYAYFMTGAITPSPKMAVEYRKVEEMLQPYLSIGLGSVFSLVYLWIFIFKPKPNP